MRILNWLFGRAEEINGNGRCATYLYRWHLLRLLGCGVYLHRFVGDDWSRDLHDHPKRFVSIGLYGSYLEETPTRIRRYRAPWLRTFPGSHLHRLTLDPGRECWTLVIVLRAKRQWGFVNAGRWIHWISYVRGADRKIADAQAICSSLEK